MGCSGSNVASTVDSKASDSVLVKNASDQMGRVRIVDADDVSTVIYFHLDKPITVERKGETFDLGEILFE